MRYGDRKSEDRFTSKKDNNKLKDNLTHICLVGVSVLINWMGPFPILGATGVLFHFFFFYRNSSKQTVFRRVLRRLI